MTLSTSRQQFLAYESQTPDNIQYERKGGIFVTTCVCITFIIVSVIVAALVGVVVYFITYFKLSQAPKNFWDETEPFGLTGSPSPDLRLPSQVVPSFYRLKLETDLDTSTFAGEVYITIRATKQTKKIILHVKDLSIKDTAKLTEQVYEKVDTIHRKKKREAPGESSEPPLNVTITETTPNSTVQPENSSSPSNNSEVITIAPVLLNITQTDPTTPVVTTDKPLIPQENSDPKAEDKVQPESNVSLVTPLSTKNPLNTQVTHSSVKNVKITSVAKASGDRLIVSLGTALRPGVDYTLELAFSGNITNDLTGFYKSTYTNSKNETRILGVTQFEPTSARAAFPCFDEPEFKAKFEISIAHHKNLTALSNMKVSAQEDFAGKPDWKWTHFERSVNMSTYLVAYVISDFSYLETSYLSKDNVTKPIKIWARPEFIHKAKYALSITPKLLQYYEEVFDLPYALDKIDLVAIPDFSSGAMENWGLMTFRETTLLFDEATRVPREKQNVAIDVSHELAHQWFGNLVTMRWWTDLWLNEGFATYVEYVGVDKIHPEWNIFESFAQEKMDLLRTDALKNTSPVSRKVIDASEISQKFDEISYTKGANLIRMLNNTISEALFHKGLSIYLNEWKYKNAEENDLWLSMTAATSTSTSTSAAGHLSVVKLMNSWTRQAGYPLVNVVRDYTTGKVTFEQSLFTTAKEPYKSMVDQIWQIPISYTRLDSKQYSSEPKLWLKERSVSLDADLREGDALYVNVDAIGYYRVNYDIRNWELLVSALEDGRVSSRSARAQLIDDVFNLAKVARLPYSLALRLPTFLARGEDSKLVWDLFLNNMVFLRYTLRTTPGYSYFLEYVNIMIDNQLKKLNYGLEPPRDDNEAFLIENLVMWECYVESPRCLHWARGLFEQWMAKTDPDDNPIPSYLRSLVYNVAVRHGGRREFMYLWEQFQRCSDPNVKSIIIGNLPSTRDESLFLFLLEQSLTPTVGAQYCAAAWSSDSGNNGHLAQTYLMEHWSQVHGAVARADSFIFPALFGAAFQGISRRDELDKLKSFALEHKEQLMPISQTLQKLVDTAELRIDWLDKHAADIQAWLKDFVQGSSGMRIITRNDLFNIMERFNVPTFKGKLELLELELLKQYSAHDSNLVVVKQKLAKIRHEFKQKWSAARSTKARFLVNNSKWLMGTVSLPKAGRSGLGNSTQLNSTSSRQPPSVANIDSVNSTSNNISSNYSTKTSNNNPKDSSNIPNNSSNITTNSSDIPNNSSSILNNSSNITNGNTNIANDDASVARDTANNSNDTEDVSSNNKDVPKETAVPVDDVSTTVNTPTSNDTNV